MKNQYFGDEKDYLTYGLLRVLANTTGLRAGIAWMLTPDAPNGQGELRAYLERPSLWQAHDPELFALLRQVPDRGRRVELAERFDLLPGACYFAEPVPAGSTERTAYFQRLFAALRDCPLLFLDPDIGLETRSVRRGAQRSPQHVYWDEISAAYHEHGHSLLIFQHFPRRTREAYLNEQAQQLADRLGMPQITWFQTSQVAFFLAARPEHQAAFQSTPGAVQARWGNRIRCGARADVIEDPVSSPAPASGTAPGGLTLLLLEDPLAVCRLSPDAPLPPWAGGALLSVTRTVDELSIVCAHASVPPGIRAEVGWRALKVAGPLDFGLTGILASLASPLAAAGISIFALSTFDTDYLLIKEDRLASAVETLRAAGHHL